MSLALSSILSICNVLGSFELSSDSIESDPSLQRARVRLIQCAVVRGYRLNMKFQAEQKISGDVTGLMVRHGTHILGLAAILEAGDPKGSTVAGEHEFTILGSYTCPDSRWLHWYDLLVCRH